MEIIKKLFKKKWQKGSGQKWQSFKNMGQNF